MGKAARDGLVPNFFRRTPCIVTAYASDTADFFANSLQNATFSTPASRRISFPANAKIKITVGNVNRSQRGWANYIHYRNSNQAMEKVKIHVEQRVRAHLMKRHKVKDRGIGEGRFPSADLYRRYGLYKVPTKAGWKSAHASV